MVRVCHGKWVRFCSTLVVTLLCPGQIWSCSSPIEREAMVGEGTRVVRTGNSRAMGLWDLFQAQ